MHINSSPYYILSSKKERARKRHQLCYTHTILLCHGLLQFAAARCASDNNGILPHNNGALLHLCPVMQ